MNQKSVLLAVASLLLVAACGSGSGLPVPTGKASFRAINAIENSPGILFKLEESTLSSVEFQGSSVTSSFDDFTYNLNFDVVFLGDNQATRVASTSIESQADQDYTLLLTGTTAAPAVTVWESTVRTFDVAATVFQARFAHAASSVAVVDYYLAADGVVPVLGDAVASSLNFTEITAPADFESGDYVLTITTAGDPMDILYASEPVTISAQRVLIITPFDGDAVNTSPIVVRALGATGTSFSMPDSNFPSTIEFLHGSPDLGNSDIYADEGLTTLIAQMHDYQQLTAAIPVASGEQIFRYTPAGSIAAVSIEAPVTIVTGFKYRITASGLSGAYSTPVTVPDRRPVDTAGKLSVFHTSNNFPFVDFYLLDRDEVLDGQLPFRAGVPPNFAVDAVRISPGSYDLYVRETFLTEVLAGPIQLNIAFGDTWEILGFDAADPAILDVRLNDLQ